MRRISDWLDLGDKSFGLVINGNIFIVKECNDYILLGMVNSGKIEHYTCIPKKYNMYDVMYYFKTSKGIPYDRITETGKKFDGTKETIDLYQLNVEYESVLAYYRGQE